MNFQVVAYSDKVNNDSETGEHQRWPFQHSLVLLVKLDIQNIFIHNKAQYASQKQKGHEHATLSWELCIADPNLSTNLIKNIQGKNLQYAAKLGILCPKQMSKFIVQAINRHWRSHVEARGVN